MRNNIEKAIEFTDKIKNIKNVLLIVLFGSVARGEDTASSDIDIAIIYNRKDKFGIMKEINRHKDEKIQTTFINLKDIIKETELMGAISGEGLLLYGKPIIIKEKNTELIPKSLIIYDLKNLPQKEKVKVNRALHGSISKSKFNGKEYKTKTLGLIKEPGIEKISKNTLLVKREKAVKIINMLKRFKVGVREIPVWSY